MLVVIKSCAQTVMEDYLISTVSVVLQMPLPVTACPVFCARTTGTKVSKLDGELQIKNNGQNILT
jgi:hypothetical protein